MWARARRHSPARLELRKRGFAVTLFERQEMPGGLNTYGIAEYKLTAADRLSEEGGFCCDRWAWSFQYRRRSGSERISNREFDAIFLGIGLGAINRLGVPGEDLPGVIDALKFIAGYKMGASIVGKYVIVIGAGNTAIDAAVAAKRLGAERVRIVYRRGEADMSAFASEYENAKLAGVRFHFHKQIERIAGADRVEGVTFDGFTMPCDQVIVAIGQLKLRDPGEVNRETGQLSNSKYFAGGDCVNGGREVVDAVADGKRAALGIAKWLI